MKSMRPYLSVYFFLLIALNSGLRARDNDLYFPPHHGAWQTVRPADVGWDRAQLQKALDYAGLHRSSGVVILHRGKILAEQYWDVPANPGKYSQRVRPKNAAGHVIEDVASVQKSVASILVGIAQAKGLLKIDDPVNQYLGTGWSRAEPAQEEAITLRHLITMTSGFSDRGVFQHKPGARWRYNTPVYAKSVDVVAAAANMDRHELTRKWITQPIGMADSAWVSRGALGARVGNAFGFATTARDLARFGLMVLAGGKWGDRTVLADQQYLTEATTTSQKLNPYYGYLWWVNSNANAPEQTPRIAAAPRDMFSANGALGRRCFVVPSLQLVVTRLGDQPTVRNNGFDRQFWRLIMAASPAGK
ncbi:MAG: serine hydrolase domain-containing protein [Planctomycetota bacterium]|jgi:CubicO group peptidase (beta-lactamase class C family)